jgi:hypothetical protein
MLSYSSMRSCSVLETLEERLHEPDYLLLAYSGHILSLSHVPRLPGVVPVPDQAAGESVADV